MARRRRRASTFGSPRSRWHSDRGLGTLGRPRRRRGPRWGTLALVVLGAGVLYYGAVRYGAIRRAAPPVTEKAHSADMPRERELALGHEAYRQILAGSQVLEAGPFVETTRDVGRQLATVMGPAGGDWTFTVVDSPVVNAFALPGGEVVVDTGLESVTRTPAGLAVALAHVMAHAVARDGAQRIVQDHLVPLDAPGAADLDVAGWRLVMGAFGVGARFGVLLPFSRAQESAADHMSVLALARACFDPEEAPRLWERIAPAGEQAPPEFLTLHPGRATHVADLGQWMGEALATRREHCTHQGSE
jgi:predicted Zn-dependent protease